jgi:hypothetical protein
VTSDAEELRALIRAVLRDVIDVAPPSSTPAPDIVDDARTVAAPSYAPRPVTPVDLGAPASTSSAAPASGPGHAGAERVRIGSQADLDALVRKVATLADNPKVRAELRSGQRRFVLDGVTAPGQRDRQSITVARGAVTEKQVRAAADAGARLVVGRAAVLTPLGRDAAKSLGVEIVKER